MTPPSPVAHPRLSGSCPEPAMPKHEGSYILGLVRAPYTVGRLKWLIAGCPLPNIL